MKLTMTNDEMAQALDTLTVVHENGKLGYAIAKNTKTLRKAAGVYLKLRADLFAKYGTISGATVTVTGAENVKAFQEELGKAPQDKEEVEIMTVPLEVFTGGRLDNVQMGALWFMLEDDGNRTDERST